MTSFEWNWRTHYRVVRPSNLRVEEEKVLFHPTYSSGTAAVIGDTALSRPDHHYWEIKFTSPVYGSDVMVGLATKKLDLATHIHSFTSFLGNDDSSLGYSYHGYVRKDGVKKRYGDKWSKGDIIGVHLDTWKGTVSFYKNRQLQGQAWAGLGGEDWFPVVSSTAAKSSMTLVNTLSFKNTLQLLCFMTLSEKYPKSDLLNIYLPPALRKFVINNYWFLDKVKNNDQDWCQPSPDRVLETRVKRTGVERDTKRTRMVEEDTSDSSGDERECFLNIKSKKLALMKKTNAVVQGSQSDGGGCSQAQSPRCTSQDFHYIRGEGSSLGASASSSCGSDDVFVDDCDVGEASNKPTTTTKARGKLRLKRTKKLD